MGFRVFNTAGQLKTTGTQGATGPAGTTPFVRTAFTAPVNSQFSWVNQGSATIRDDTDSVVLVGAATGAGANIQVRVKTAPSTPYVLTTFLVPLMPEKAFQSYGLCWRASGSGSLVLFDVLAADLGLTTPFVRATKFTSATAFSADYTTLHVPQTVNWFRIADDGTTRTCSWSSDGIDWLVLHTVGHTDFITPNQIGFFVSTENSATPNFAPVLRVCHWLQT